MIHKGKEFEADCRKLKQLSAKRTKSRSKYGKEYIDFRDSMTKKYDVDVRTVQLWIKRRTPWIRDKRDDVGKERKKVSRKITALINDGIDAGLTQKKVRKIVEEKSGEKVSDRIFQREVKKEVENTDTPYGDEAKAFFRNLFEIDLIPSDKGLKMKYKKTKFLVLKSDLEDICRILSNAYNRYADAPDKMKINRAADRKSKLWQMYDEAVNIINHRGVSIADLKEVSLFIQRLEIDRNKISPRIQTFWKILQNYSPEITLDEVISLAEEYEGVYD